MIPIQRLDDLDDAAKRRLLDRGRLDDPEVTEAVAALVAEVREAGDAALRIQVARFDGVELDDFVVPRSSWEEALAGLDSPLVEALEAAASSIRRFHTAQLPEPLEREVAPGLTLGRRPDPLRAVGVYAPGGRAAYPSSVLMGVVPARVAGVGQVVVCSPPGPDGKPSPLVQAACAVAGADRLLAVGGAGAIAALAYGTESVPRVDRIVGPGNAYVAEAKRQVSAAVRIDSPAGPSELLVLADMTADPEVVATELIAQAEHDPDAAVVLVTTDIGVAEATAAALARLVPEAPRREIVEASLSAAGGLLLADSMAEAVGFAETYAPEHMLVLTEAPREVLRGVRAVGTVFLGPRSSVAFGDYATGANHVLPTGGLARSYSGLSVDDFVRWTTWQEVSTGEATRTLAAVTEPLARAEGLPGHAAAARLSSERASTSAPSPPDVSRTPQSLLPEPAMETTGPAGSSSIALKPRRPYREMTHYDPRRPPLGMDLSANTNLWGACPAGLREVRDYGAPTGYPTVYGELLKQAAARTWSVDISEVVTGCGSDDIIDSAIRAFCEPGAVVAFPAPTFPMADVFARMNDTRPRPVPMAVDGTLAEGALEALVAADLVYLCRPNNPTGAVIDRDVVVALLDRARGLVLIDEAYGEYAGETLARPALESGRGLVLRTFSKAYGLAGLRVGYGIGPAPVVRAVELSRGPYKVNGPAERAASSALARGGPWVRDIVERTVENRGRLASALTDRGFGVVPGRANFVLVATGPDNAALLKAALANRGIGVRAFEDIPGLGDALRITVGPWELMQRFLTALDGILAAGIEIDPPDVEALS